MFLCSDILCCAKSDMLAYGNRDMETCGFRDFLFATKLPQAITLVERQILLRSNITRHKANKTAECPPGHSANAGLFMCHTGKRTGIYRYYSSLMLRVELSLCFRHGTGKLIGT